MAEEDGRHIENVLFFVYRNVGRDGAPPTQFPLEMSCNATLLDLKRQIIATQPTPVENITATQAAWVKLLALKLSPALILRKVGLDGEELISVDDFRKGLTATLGATLKPVDIECIIASLDAKLGVFPIERFVEAVRKQHTLQHLVLPRLRKPEDILFGPVKGKEQEDSNTLKEAGIEDGSEVVVLDTYSDINLNMTTAQNEEGYDAYSSPIQRDVKALGKNACPRLTPVSAELICSSFLQGKLDTMSMRHYMLRLLQICSASSNGCTTRRPQTN